MACPAYVKVPRNLATCALLVRKLHGGTDRVPDKAPKAPSAPDQRFCLLLVGWFHMLSLTQHSTAIQLKIHMPPGLRALVERDRCQTKRPILKAHLLLLAKDKPRSIYLARQSGPRAHQLRTDVHSKLAGCCSKYLNAPSTTLAMRISKFRSSNRTFLRASQQTLGGSPRQ